MQVTKETAAALLRDFGIDAPVEALTFYINHSDGADVKIIFRADVTGRGPLVVKITREENHPPDKIERQSAFSEHLRKNGIPTPRVYSSGGRFCQIRRIGGETAHVTVQDWCGEELSALDFALAGEMGALLARMHTVSLRDGLAIGWGTIFNALGQNDVSGYDDLKALAGQQKLNPPLCEEILRLFDERLARVRPFWGHPPLLGGLPRAAVQGDISINNLACPNGALTIFDYNIAGDEVLVSDMVLEGLLTAWEMDLAPALSEACRPEIFRHFAASYQAVRPLTVAEKAAARELYPAYNALWFSKISPYGTAGSLARLAENGKWEEAKAVLEETHRLITAEPAGLFA